MLEPFGRLGFQALRSVPHHRTCVPCQQKHINKKVTLETMSPWLLDTSKTFSETGLPPRSRSNAAEICECGKAGVIDLGHKNKVLTKVKRFLCKKKWYIKSNQIMWIPHFSNLVRAKCIYIPQIKSLWRTCTQWWEFPQHKHSANPPVPCWLEW